MALLDFLTSTGRRRRRWRREEKTWIQQNSFPPIVVRDYVHEAHLKRDRRHLRRLGYRLKFTTLDKYPPHHWYATYERDDQPGSG